MLKKVNKSVHDLCLLYGVKTLAVAVSGGADSVALLYAMLKLKDEYGIDIFAVHFNHNLRGEESERDEEFVKKLCDKLGVRLICGEGDVRKFAKEQKMSIELAARHMRYKFFEELNADAVATAHTASDNLETMIFNLTRGTAIDGLCGIPPKRGKYVRPLICCTREEIEAYCKQNDLSYVTDSTNLCDNYSRNLIRHKIVPILKGLNPSVENNAINTSLSLSFDRDMLDMTAKQEYKKMLTDNGLNIAALTDLEGAISGRILRMFCKENTGIAPDYSHTNDLFDVAVNGGRCSLEGGFEAVRQKSILKIFSLRDKHYFNVKITKIDKINNLLSKNYIDCDKIVGKLIVRTREPGDKIRLSGRGCTKTLKCLYNENSISPEKRSVLPVISDDLGVVWVCGIGVDERVTPDEKTQFVYKISY